MSGPAVVPSIKIISLFSSNQSPASNTVLVSVSFKECGRYTHDGRGDLDGGPRGGVEQEHEVDGDADHDAQLQPRQQARAERHHRRDYVQLWNSQINNIR